MTPKSSKGAGDAGKATQENVTAGSSTNSSGSTTIVNAQTANTQASGHGLSQSESTREISKALLAFQSEMPAVGKDASNPFYKSKYATLANIWQACQPVLARHGLIVSQSSGEAYEVGKNLFNDFHTRVTHAESGEWIESTAAVPFGKTDPQGYGSTNTYSRRYTLSPILGIVVDDDDDGNAASGKLREKEPPPPPNYVTENPKPEKKVKAIERVQNFLFKAGCKTPKDKDLVIKHVNPNESVETVKTHAIAERFIEEVNAAIKSKSIYAETVLEEARKQASAAEAADAFPI